MNKLIELIEKGKPFFEKISRNKYLRAIRDGFIAGMPVILFSSIFILIAYVPNAWGFHWSKDIETFLMTPYSYSMGILAFFVGGTTAKALTDSMNRDLPATNQINFISTMLASMVGFLLMAAEPAKEGGFLTAFMGTKGLLTAFIAAFVTVNVYKVCVKNNVTIRMPDEVPPNISQVFKDLIPFTLSVVLLYALELVVKASLHVTVAESIGTLLAPLFSAADGYVGITIIFGAFAFFWFIGIHGPSIVEPAIAAITYANAEVNLNLLQQGMHADKILTSGTQMFIVTMGGTGATLVVPFMFMWLCKSKRNRAIGRASVVPTFFGVNEPILFGAPLVLNPIFFIPFIFAPIANVWIFKFFIETLGMNSFTANLPWTTPGPLGIVLGTNFQFLSFALAALLIVVDIVIYYPFLKVYDEQILEEERSGKTNDELKEKVAANFNTAKADAILEKAGVDSAQNTITEETNVLVLCAGGGTSGLLANALNKAAEEYKVPVKAAAGGYGAHREMLPEFDLVILAPQVASNFEDMKAETDKLGIKLAKTEGAQYIKLTRDGKGALAFVQAQFEE
ncbi:lactose-specific PTS transporter subunit EIIC [Streptococcus parasanguinis]|jgi:PTS system lactose-specific IIC component|uniref:PTS system lactose-specific EIICB component n=1 Tax=Streptococcus parasanguinis CC87K TaxID=1073372 RepID=V8BI02_STRPA|nr:MULTISPECIES: lactose-specific PTS transporter subunit EIIC [Streptococcus]ETD14392.1 PTS system lactose-specific EIICB component [Streptococcus parasanguinis CC87K]MBS5222320.1 lactose-specific PTS transporter subunit EIIC [Streptococcus parasanguinis]MCP8962053.1 lactose-specific PTS transporter subunit EIIC [Streptococcus sp. CF8_St5-12]MCP8979993.1 lactose-specific PTS transporter subunit EIIC [Streptococcus sp. CF8_St5-16]MCP8981923.1 lactose-specific PTS transporter subunit EIIC [Stre